jgi:hypothetical protein
MPFETVGGVGKNADGDRKNLLLHAAENDFENSLK